MDGSFGFLSGDEGAALFGEDLKAKKDDEIIGIGLHFCERLKE
ncbi:MAG: hypothetical protein U9Q03_01035 [Patescibacteria group bacterium]|nr:hypothetical protein [Patescibacteria group bacterium]